MMIRMPEALVSRRFAPLLAAFAFAAGATEVSAGHALEGVVGKPIEDPATPNALAFRWFIEGDEDRDAKVVVSYRKSGEGAWSTGLPLLRIKREVVPREGGDFVCGNLFAGSVMGLEPGSRYEVRLELSDPDGGKAEETMVVETRPLPVPYAGDRIVKVADAAALAGALADARPGDVILLAAGKYIGNFKIDADGAEGKPITVRAEGDAVIEGKDGDAHVFDLTRPCSFLSFEGLVIRHGRTGIKANGSRNLVVRDCAIEDVAGGIISYTTGADNWYVADNMITGRVKEWYPRKSSSDTGVNCPGRGHVVCHNRIRRFWDGISTANFGIVPQEWAEMESPPQVGIDIFGNDISEIMDDGIECDDTLGNVRVTGNRIFNTHAGLTAQPEFGGPLYWIRNEIYNTTYAPFKLHNSPTGLFLIHNTAVGADQGFASFPPTWRNATLRGNLILGARRYAVETGSPDKATSLDYNGYYRAEAGIPLIKWSADGGKNWAGYEDLEAFRKATGHEVHGKEIGRDVLVDAPVPEQSGTYATDEVDLSPAENGGAVDAAAVIPGLIGKFSGTAPDMGCREYGEKAPHYGPRRD